MNLLRFAVLPLVALASSAAADPCPPIAVVKGSGKAAQELSSALIGRGIRVEPAGLPGGTCAVLHAEVSASDDGYTVWIGDSWGRTAERRVRDLLTAVVLVESWARMDLLEAPGTSSVSVGTVPAPIAAAPEPEPQPAPAAPAPVAVAAAVPVGDLIEPVDESPSLSVRLAGEGAINADRTRWVGGALTVCARLGPLCVGGVGRYNISQQRQSNAEGLFAVRLPIELGRFALTPHVGAGAGWASVSNERGGGRHGGHGGGGEVGARAQAGVDLSFRLFGDLHLAAGGSVSGAPRFDRKVELDPTLSALRAQVGLVWGSP